MRQNSIQNRLQMISMEEYLKRRQALKRRKVPEEKSFTPEPADALRLAKLLYV